MLPSPLTSLSCFHYLADKQSKNARSTTEKPVRHGRTAGVCLTKRERPESRNARPREPSLKSQAMKTVKECGSLFEAQVVRQRLESERIQAFVLNENSNDYVPFAGAIPLLAVQVVVADDDYERVRDLLAEETASERPIVCPECGSQGVRSEVGETRLKRFGAYLLAAHWGTARQATSAGISGATGAERRSISSLCSSDGKRFQLHARNARQSAEGLLGFFSRSDVPVRGCVSDAWPEAPGRCEKPAETTARHRLIRNSDYLAFTTKRCRSGNGRIADALPDGSATDSRFRTSISKRASK